MTFGEQNQNSRSYNNLLTPQLYGLYGNDTIAEEEEDRYMALVDLYLSTKGLDPVAYLQDKTNVLPSAEEMQSYLAASEPSQSTTSTTSTTSIRAHAKSDAESGARSSSSAHTPHAKRHAALRLLKAAAALAVAGIAYTTIINAFYEKQMLIHPTLEHVLQPFLGSSYTVSALVGVGLGAGLYCADCVLQYESRAESLTTLVKLTNAILGMFLGLKKIEWRSANEASLMWFCLNFMLWLFFDCTASLLCGGIVLGSVFGYIHSTSILTHLSVSDSIHSAVQEVSPTSLLLFNINFIFNTVLFFGKLSRYLRQ